MKIFKKIITLKVTIITIIIVVFFSILIGIITSVFGVAVGYQATVDQASKLSGDIAVVNNQIYASRYKNLLNKYLVDKGYVSLERLIFYLQRKNNILDITTLQDSEWEKAYLDNINEKEKQMIPIKTICKNLNNDSTIPTFTVESGLNSNGIYIEVINLCIVDNIDITTSSDFSEDYPYLPYAFPLKDNFVISSMVFENREVDLGFSKQGSSYHGGWDIAVPIGTNFYSICNGTINEIVNTQYNDLPYNQSKNDTGNYVTVQCDNGLIVSYLHIKANSVPTSKNIGSFINEGDLLGKTSTTGLSTGPHLHLGLQNSSGEYLDAFEYINFNYKKG